MSDDKFLGDFAEQFSRQVRSGHVPSEDELKKEFPELAEELMGFASTLSILEEAGFEHRIRGASPTVADASGRRWTHIGGFRLIREIGRGGMGIVYEAEQEALQRRVAIKVLPSNPLLTEKHLARFKREGMAIARLHHSHIVPVFGTGEQNGVHYCVMQFIEGCSLDQLVQTLRREYAVVDSAELAVTNDSVPSEADAPNDDALSVDQEYFNTKIELNSTAGASPSLESIEDLLLGKNPSAVADSSLASVQVNNTKGKRRPKLPKTYWKNIARIGAEMAEALSHAHGQGVLHRDVKPGNLLIDKCGHVWLTDFGVAKLMDHGNVTMTGGLIGTLRYAPPEQLEGKSDERSDIYSLGLTLYELCALQPAFSANDRRGLMRQITESAPPKLSRRMPGIPPDLETVINKAIASAPADRYQRSADLAKDLRNFVTDHAVTARKLTMVARSWRWCRRHRTESALGATIAMMLIAFGITASVAYLREARLRRELQGTASTAISAINRVYDSYLPDWTTSSTVSAHGSISVSPATAQLLSGLLRFYDELATRSSRRPEDNDLLEVTAALRRVGLIYQRLGMFSESKVAYGKAIVRINSTSLKSGSDRIHLEHARVRNEIGALYWTERQIAEAFESHQAALEILQRINEPSEPGVRREILFEKARTAYLMGRRARGRHGGVPLRPVITRRQENFDKKIRSPEARAENIGNATEILIKLVNETPKESAYRHLLALCYLESSEGPISNVGQAERQIAMAIDILEKLVQEKPQQPAYLYSLCICLLSLDLAQDASELAMSASAERMDRAIGIARELAQEHPDEWIYVAAEVEAQLLKANVQSRRGLANEAHESATRAILEGVRLAEKYPNCLSFQYWVGVAHQQNGNSLVDSGQIEEALMSFENAYQVFRDVYRSNPTWGHVVLRDLKHTSSLLAKVLALSGKNEAAEVALREAEEYAAQHAQTLADVK